MTVIISNQRVKIRSFSINTHPMSIVSPASRYLGKAMERSMTHSSFLVDEADEMTLNPYSRAFFLLWLAASLVAVGMQYIQ